MTINESDVVIPEGVTLLGAAAGTDVVSAGRAVETDPIGETIIVQPVTFKDGAQVDGVTLKAKPVIESGVEEIGILNSRLLGLTITTGSNLDKAVIGMDQWTTPAVVNIDGNYFGDNTGVYNVFELNVPLKDGSSFSNNSFSADAGSHNMINIYAVDDNANIDIKDNYFEKSANAIRFGTKGSPVDVTVNIEGNSYTTTDSDVAYAGLLLIQPYAKATEDMGDVVINLDDTDNQSGIEQIWYYYAGTGDAQLTVDQRPKVYINGNLQPYSI